MSSAGNNYIISETTEILIDLGPMKDTIHQIPNQHGSSLITSTYAQKISPKLLHVCFICDKICVNSGSLTRHLTKHNVVARETTSRVNQDGKVNSPAKNTMDNGQEKVNPSGKLCCEYCRELFDNQEDLTKHEQNIHFLCDGFFMEKHFCGYCGVKFSRRKDLFHHIQCCGTLSAVDSCKLATEINLRSNSNKQPDKNQPLTAVDYFCLNCKKKRSFKILSLDRTKKLLKLNCRGCGNPLHLSYFVSELAKDKDPQETDDSNTITELCQDNGQLASTPQSPLVIDDDDDSVTYNEDPPHETPIINKAKVIVKAENTLKNFPQVIRMLNKHSKFKCHICYKKFSSVDGLNDHFNSAHAGVKRQKYSCPYCSKSYITAKLYLRHLQSHVRLKKISCHYQLLLRSSSLPFYNISDYQHKEKHCTCLHCSERFSNSVELLDHHKESHPNNSIHVCQVCSCQFVSNKSLKQHRKRHSVKNFYKCDFCFKTFTKMSVFLQHVLQHARISF